LGALITPLADSLLQR